MIIVLIGVSVAVMEHCVQNQLGGGKGLFGLYNPVIVPRGKPRQELGSRCLEAGTEAGAMEESCLQTLSSWPA